MFTGIISEIGAITAIEKRGDWVMTIKGSAALLDSLSLGASVACSGVCLTVIALPAGAFTVQASAETLSKTTLGAWDVGTPVNLERALRIGDELGGHIVSGHVDGLARVVSRMAEGESVRFRFEVSVEFAPFLAPKGSVTLDGISLTVNEVEGNVFGVNIIPHTQTATTIGGRNVGDMLNFEIDVIARYVGRMLDYKGCL